MSSDKQETFRLPPPKFEEEAKRSLDNFTKLRNPHFSTPSGMLLPRNKQPPPMYGPRGSTVPPRFLTQYSQKPSRGHYQQGFRSLPQGYFKERETGTNDEVIPELLKIDWTLWCEGCDVNFKTEHELNIHLKQHKRCKRPGCNYVGHPSVMKHHWRRAHDEKRLQEKNKIASKESPEEIDSWRLERKKRYPTKVNVELRRLAQLERFKRGERVEADKRRFPSREPAHKAPIRRGRKQFPAAKRVVKARNSEQNQLTEVQDDCRVNFKGTSGMEAYHKKPKNALNLLCDYGTDTDDSSADESESLVQNDKQLIGNTQQSVIIFRDDNEPQARSLSDGEIIDSDEDEVIGQCTQILSVPNETKLDSTRSTQDVNKSGSDETKLCDINNSEPTVNSIRNTDIVHATGKNEPSKQNSNAKVDQNDCCPLQDTIEKTEAFSERTTHKTRNRKRRHGTNTTSTTARKQNKSLLDYSKLGRTQQNTMLEKLLEPDIRHERNLLMQCVRFVVENKFFGIGQSQNPGNSCSKST